MGTRSIIKFQNEGVTFVSVYQQYDGYPSEVGKSIADLLNSRDIVNGYTNKLVQANGAHCLAAQYVALRKKPQAGELYLYGPDASDMWEEYRYTVNVDENLNVTVSVDSYDQTISFSDMLEFAGWCKGPGDSWPDNDD